MKSCAIQGPTLVIRDTIRTPKSSSRSASSPRVQGDSENRTARPQYLGTGAASALECISRRRRFGCMPRACSRCSTSSLYKARMGRSCRRARSRVQGSSGECQSSAMARRLGHHRLIIFFLRYSREIGGRTVSRNRSCAILLRARLRLLRWLVSDREGSCAGAVYCACYVYSDNMQLKITNGHLLCPDCRLPFNLLRCYFSQCSTNADTQMIPETMPAMVHDLLVALHAVAIKEQELYAKPITPRCV